MSMYATNHIAINHIATNHIAINHIVVGTVRSKPTASSPPYLRLVAAPLPLQGRTSSAVFWRRRMAVLIVIVAVAVATQAWVGGSHAAPEAPRAGSRTAAASTEAARPGAYVVRQGDTLWAIARRLRPDGDVRPVVDRLAAQRRGVPLRVGERIALPADG